ncbi:MAG: hypothetical protein WB607_26455 [Candidatus Acidiferrum sp.]
MRAKYIGPYQRPAPPKRPLGLNSRKTIQKPAAPMHEIQAQEQRLLEDIKANGNVLGLTAKVRKPGRPSVYEEPMTPAERQARRRALQARSRDIQETLKIGDSYGKSRGEAKSGGYSSEKIDIMIGLQDFKESIGGKRVSPRGTSSCSDEKTYEDSFDAGEFDPRGGAFESGGAQRIHVHGLQFGDEESNRRRFAEEELRKMAEKYFASPEVYTTPSASWVARHIGNVSVRCHERPSITMSCTMCGESMEFIDDAIDHLRVDHRKTINDWFKSLEPPREFRDMGVFVSVVNPRKRKGI